MTFNYFAWDTLNGNSSFASMGNKEPENLFNSINKEELIKERLSTPEA